MAKVTRIIRKLAPPGRSFDEQLWPVFLALLVLGGYLSGIAIALFEPRDGLGWALVAAVIALIMGVVGGSMGLLYLVDSTMDARRINRRTLLSLVLALIITFIGLTGATKVTWYAALQEVLATDVSREDRYQRVIPEYHDFQLEQDQQPKRDFQKPVETPDIEEKPEEVEREKTAEPEEAKPKPQQVVTPEPEPEVDPHAIKREVQEETASRRSQPESKLSRQNVKFQPTTAPPAATVKVEQPKNKPNNVKAQTAEVKRQQNDAQSQRQPKNVEPTTTTEVEKIASARRDTVKEQITQNTSAPTLQRAVNQPKQLPRTNTQAEKVATAAAQQTDPSELQPNTISTSKQQTTNTATPKDVSRPTPDTPSEIANQSTQRQQLAERMTQQARSAQPVVNRTAQTRTLPRPTATAAAAVAPTTSPRSTPQENIRASAANVTRQNTNNSTPQATPTPTDTPETNPTQQIAEATTQRAQTSPTVTANPTARPNNSPSRTQANPTIAPSNQAQAVQVATHQPNEVSSPKPAGVSTSKQSTTSAATANVTNPQSVETPTDVSRISPTTQTRQQVAQTSPTMASTPKPVLSRTRPTETLPSAANVAAATATPTQSPVANQSDSPTPSTSQVARQSTQNNANSSSPQAMETPTQSPTSQLARTQTQRAQTADTPTINPTARPTNSPARASRASNVAASPAPVAAPAVAQSARQTSNPSAEPARTALSKAFGGVAGVGRSENLDRNQPAADRPAQVASGSAQRAKATQQMQPGPALSPSNTARISRARAGAQAPSATLLAQATESATRAGAAEPADIEASASAAIAKAASNADAGDVTADKGNIEIDRGATQQISENATGKASGGGQMAMNFETQSRNVARAKVGGNPEISIAVAKAAQEATAPSAAGGGEPSASEASPEATSVVRTEQGGESPATGGPTSMAQSDVTNESSTAQVVADSKVGRTETVEAAMNAPKLGGGSSSPARSSTGPKLASSVLAKATAEPATTEAPQGDPQGTPAEPTDSALARQESGGAPTAGGPSRADEAGEPSEAAGEAATAEAALAQAEIGKAEAVESTVGAPSAGGGTGTPTRAAKGPAFAAAAQAATVALAGEPASSGKPNGNPIEAQGGNVAKATGGAAGTTGGEAGAMASDQIVDAAPSGAPGELAGEKRAAPGSADGPVPGDTSLAGGPLKRGAKLNLPPGTAQEVALAEVGGGSPEPGDLDDMMGGMDSTGVSRQQPGGLAVEVSAPEGPGGLGTEVALDTGTMNRRAQEDSQEVHFRPARFIRKKTGGPLSINLVAATGTKAFSGRSKFKNKDFGSPGSDGAPPKSTEKSINLGLRFLSRHQSNDGSWSLSDFGAGRRGYEREKTALHSDTAATGLCLLSFLGAGYDHRGDEYEEVIKGGLDFLIKNQKDDGDLFINQDPESSRAVWLYSHGIASIALCEAYGMTQDPDLREPAQKALDFIAKGQNEARGGWRYSPGFGSDTSVTGWMMMALKSGELAGLDVKKETLEGIDKWLDSAQASKAERHLYVYNPLAPDTDTQRHGRKPSKTMTSVGLLMRLYSGWRRDNPDMIRGARYLAEQLPANGTKDDPQRDTYYWYYATQVMFHMGGEFWEKWQDALHPMLTDSQIQSGAMAGSWDPRGPIRDQWGPHAGRVYVTTLNILSLEVAHRHLPIYEDTAN